MESLHRHPRGTNDHAIFDFKLPPFVRSFLAINSLNATCLCAVEDAGHLPKLYGRFDGKPVRVVMVSRLGDIGIASKDNRRGYFARCFVYDLTDYSETAPADLPPGDEK